MEKYLPTLLLCLMYILANLYIFWQNDLRMQNWIYARSVPMTVGWNVKFASDQGCWIVLSLMVITYGRSRNKVNSTSMFVFLLWCIFDSFVYFYNYKTVGYFAMYAWLPVAWLLIYYWKSKTTDRLWKLIGTKK